MLAGQLRTDGIRGETPRGGSELLAPSTPSRHGDPVAAGGAAAGAAGSGHPAALRRRRGARQRAGRRQPRAFLGGRCGGLRSAVLRRRGGLLRCVDLRLVGPVQPARRRQLHPRKTVLLPEERRVGALSLPELHQLVQARAPAATSSGATTARSRSAARAATPAATPAAKRRRAVRRRRGLHAGWRLPGRQVPV
jgi:hypothetical protein